MDLEEELVSYPWRMDNLQWLRWRLTWTTVLVEEVTLLFLLRLFYLCDVRSRCEERKESCNEEETQVRISHCLIELIQVLLQLLSLLLQEMPPSQGGAAATLVQSVTRQSTLLSNWRRPSRPGTRPASPAPPATRGSTPATAATRRTRCSADPATVETSDPKV